MEGDAGKEELQWSTEQLSPMDIEVAPGLRLWMLLAFMASILTLMVVTVCCFMKIRIPRTKRQIELASARRKLQQKRSADAKTKADSTSKSEHLRLSVTPAGTAPSASEANRSTSDKHSTSNKDKSTSSRSRSKHNNRRRHDNAADHNNDGELLDPRPATAVSLANNQRRSKNQLITDV